MYTVYILQSKVTGRYYVGQTADFERRLIEHNEGRTRSLRNQAPFTLVYREDYETRQEAFRRERQIKRYKGGEAFKRLIRAR